MQTESPIKKTRLVMLPAFRTRAQISGFRALYCSSALSRDRIALHDHSNKSQVTVVDSTLVIAGESSRRKMHLRADTNNDIRPDDAKALVGPIRHEP